jgi:nanoRNase/pAp phosphatase (c-di-AMP/oligoRNAs hydrolase)
MLPRLDDLARSLEGVQRLLILPHNDPDPDAIASALALRTLVEAPWPAHEGRHVAAPVEATIVYRGIIGRAENKALVRYLDRPLRRLLAGDLRQEVPVALVDTQPGAGNNALPPDRTPLLVFDHHPLRPGSAAATFAEVRPEVGATSTILTSYLLAAGLEPDKTLATALYYGIKSDTLSLAREAASEDIAIYQQLQILADAEALAEIENAQVPSDYFKRLDTALHTARVYDGVVLAYIGQMRRPDLAAELADLLLRLQGARWAVCMGVYKDDLIVSIRARPPRMRGVEGGAGSLVQSIVGEAGTAGGHGTMAAGHVPLYGRDPAELSRQLSQQVLLSLGVRDEGKPLLDGLD